jgi:hypothetical protein
MVYIPREWTDAQIMEVHRTILELENYCRNLPIEKQHDVKSTIERLKSALPDHYNTINKQHD